MTDHEEHADADASHGERRGDGLPLVEVVGQRDDLPRVDEVHATRCGETDAGDGDVGRKGAV